MEGELQGGGSGGWKVCIMQDLQTADLSLSLSLSKKQKVFGSRKLVF